MATMAEIEKQNESRTITWRSAFFVLLMVLAVPIFTAVVFVVRIEGRVENLNQRVELLETNYKEINKNLQLILVEVQGEKRAKEILNQEKKP